MTEMIEIAIPVDVEAARALENDELRAAVGRLITKVVLPNEGPSELARAIAAIKEEARANGLTDEDIDEELRIYNSERRGPSAA